VNASHPGEIDHQTTFTGPQACAIMSPTAHSQRKFLGPGEIDCHNNISSICTLSYQSRALVNHTVINFSHLIVADILRCNYRSMQSRFDVLNLGIVQHFLSFVYF
jgi:hypothetical protein